MDITHLVPFHSPIVIIDVESVLADSIKAITNYLEEKFPCSANMTFPDLSIHYATEMEDIYKNPTFFLTVPPVPNSVANVKKMIKMGYHVILYLNNKSGFVDCLNSKISWVSKHLGAEGLQRIYFANDKTLIRGNYFISDRNQTAGKFDPEWKQIILDMPHNRNLTCKRINNWSEWETVIPQNKRNINHPLVDPVHH